MHRIRLWTASLVSRVDSMVTRIENHESLAQSAIRDVRRSAARARVQLRRVRGDGDRIRERLDAESERGGDLARSRGGLRRRGIATRRSSACGAAARPRAIRQELANRLEEHEHVEKQLSQPTSRGSTSVSRSSRTSATCSSTRQSRAEALGSVREAQAPLGVDVDEIFGRWETQVAEREYVGDCVTSDADRFESEFEEADEKAALEAELEDLLGETRGGGVSHGISRPDLEALPYAHAEPHEALTDAHVRTDTGRTGADPALSDPQRTRRACRACCAAVGAGVLLASASSFLLQHWATGGDLVALLHPARDTPSRSRSSASSGACGPTTRRAHAPSWRWPPASCRRTSAILGGLVYSQFSWEGGAAPVAQYASWVAPSPAAALVAVGASLTALGGVIALAFASLVRERATNAHRALSRRERVDVDPEPRSHDRRRRRRAAAGRARRHSRTTAGAR